MSLKTRLRISIVALAALVVVGLSILYLWDFTRLAFHEAHGRAQLMADDVKDYVSERVDEYIGTRGLHPATAAQFGEFAKQAIQSDPRVSNKLRETLVRYGAVLNIRIVSGDKVLATSEASGGHNVENPTYDFSDLDHRNAFRNLWNLFFRNQDYTTSLPLMAVGGTEPSQAFCAIKVTIQSVLLHKVLAPAFLRLMSGFFGALAVAMFLAAVLPNIFLSPLERVSKRIELISAGEGAEPGVSKRGETREFADVQSKLDVLGQQFRGAKQDAVALRRNVESMLQQLEEAVLLFDAEGHLMMAGRAVEPLLGVGPRDLLGRTVEQVFSESSEIADAIRMRRPWRDRVVSLKSADSSPLLAVVSVEPLANTEGKNVGTLITLRDAETRRRIEVQLDVAARLAALSRLTSGVAHEIKNPLNAMALHLEVLKTRLDDEQPEIEVISREIKRLDHVVKTFLNFNKPLDLKMDTINLSALADDVATLVSLDAKKKGIVVEKRLSREAWISGDHGLVQQALLNVVLNAMEAMQHDGRLEIATQSEDGESIVVVTDSGPGIPVDVQDKIFNLYFSTKESGSGIGLAMTFRVIQMHSGTIDFVSEPGKGTSFRLRFPTLSGYGEGSLSRAAQSGRRA